MDVIKPNAIVGAESTASISSSISSRLDSNNPDISIGISSCFAEMWSGMGGKLIFRRLKK